MKHLFTIIILIIFSSCNMESPKNTEILEQNPEEIIAIKNVLINQQKCWNNGDIDGFMEGYWNSEELIFTSLSHEPAFGWENTLERYKNSYPTKESMGNFNFKILELKLISDKSARLKGKWELIRKDDNPNGLFWLNLEKFEENWLITKDSTISFDLIIPA